MNLVRKLKQVYWTVRKKTIRRYYVSKGVFARDIVPLTAESAKRVYGRRRDLKISSYIKKAEGTLRPPGHLPEDERFECFKFTFPQAPAEYNAVSLDIRNPNFTFQYSQLLDDRNRVIYFPQVKFRELPMWPFKLRECKKLRGTVAYLSNTLFCQYAHWLQMQLPMLTAYWELYGKEAIDYYYIGDSKIKPFALECLLQMGIREDQVVDYPLPGGSIPDFYPVHEP